MSIAPAADSFTTTRFGTVCPAAKLRSEAVGIVAPCGQMTRSLAVVGFVTVTLRITAFESGWDAAMTFDGDCHGRRRAQWGGAEAAGAVASVNDAGWEQREEPCT